jgi:hypothetical protein
LSVLDEGYSGNASCSLNLIYTFHELQFSLCQTMSEHRTSNLHRPYGDFKK